MPQESPKETGQVMAICYPLWGCGPETGQQRKIKKNLNELWTWDHIKVSNLAHELKQMHHINVKY